MPRRVVSNKKKNYAGNRSYGGGNAKNRRGKGNKGGKGRAGIRTHKWFYKIKQEGTVAAKGMGFINPHPASRHALLEINLKDVAKLAKNGVVELKGTKVLSIGNVHEKLHVKAAAFSAKAKEKIEKAGGKAELIGGEGKTASDAKNILPAQAILAASKPGAKKA
jgi:large subunit ribosomal protein L15